MKAYFFTSLFFLALNSNATENIETINKLTDRICSNRVEKNQCEEAINAIVSLSIYTGYASGVCGDISGAQIKFNSDCIKAQKEMQKILKQITHKKTTSV